MTRDVIFRLKVEDDPRNKGVMGGFSQQIARLKAELDRALSGSGGRVGGGGSGPRGGTGGRNGPNDDLKDRIKLAGQLLNQQIKDADKLAAKLKRDADADLQYRVKLAGQLLNQQIKNAEKLAATQRKEAERTARETEAYWRGVNREMERSVRQTNLANRRRQRIADATERRQDAATNRILRGGFGAIGQIGGLLGGDTGSALGNVALGGHVAHQTYEGGKGIVGGIGSLIGPRGANGLPLAAGSNAAVAAGTPVAAAGAAAIVAWLPALAMAVRGATIAIQGSESSASAVKFKGGRLFDVRSNGSLGSAFGEGVASSSLNHSRFLYRNLSDAALQREVSGQSALGDRRGNFFSGGDNALAQANLELSNRALTRQQGALGGMAARRAYIQNLSSQVGISDYDPAAFSAGRNFNGVAGIGTASSIGAGSVGTSRFLSARQIREQEMQFGEIRRQGSLSMLGLAGRSAALATSGRERIQAGFDRDSAIYSNTSIDKATREDAGKRLEESGRRLIALEREKQSIVRETAQVQLSTAKQEYDLRKQLADEAEENYKSDAERFALSDPSQRAAAKTAFAKLDAGAQLTKRDIEAVQGYSYRRDDVRKATTSLAEQYGGDFLKNSKEEAKRRRAESDEALKDVEAKTISLDNAFKVEVELKNDATFAQVFLPKLAPVLEQMQKAANDQIEQVRKDLEQQIKISLGNRPIPGTR